MPVLLTEFLVENGAKGDIAPLFEKLYQNAPEVTETSKLKDYSARYRALPEPSPEKKAFDAIWEHLIRNTQPALFDPNKKINFFGESITLPENALMLRAFKFESSNMGNCSHRASYAAMKLYEMLKNTPIQIIVKSSKQIDHFVVYLKNKDEETWFIYDPLTNPELVFGFEEYQKEIIPAFKPTTSKVLLSVSVIIEDDFCQRYSRLYPKLMERLSAEVDALNVKKLQAIPSFSRAISSYCGVDHPKKLLEAACEELKATFGKKSLALKAVSDEASEAPPMMKGPK